MLAGTDLSRYLHSDPQRTRHSMALADGLIGLHDEVAAEVPSALRERLMIVHQSAQAATERWAPREDCFEVCVVGHLREEKDSLLAAKAVRELPKASRLRVHLLGRAMDDVWRQRAEAEQCRNRRFVWLGEVAPEQVRETMARARVMVISSRAEGGANVVSEACVAGLPVIASDIPGNRGLLGKDYPGYFPVGDSLALRRCLLRAESEPEWLATLRWHCQKQASLFTPEAESAALARAIAKVTEVQGR